MRSGLPIALRISRTDSSAAASPPTMNVNVPSIAPISPPLTGASSMAAPSSCARPANRRAMAGEIVLESTTTVPFCIAPNTPFAPSSTFSTSGPSGNIVMTTRAACATSAGEFAAVAPAATSASTGPRLRLWTTTSKPFLRRLSAMGLPMRPRPMKPMGEEDMGGIIVHGVHRVHPCARAC